MKTFGNFLAFAAICISLALLALSNEASADPVKVAEFGGGGSSAALSNESLFLPQFSFNGQLVNFSGAGIYDIKTGNQTYFGSASVGKRLMFSHLSKDANYFATVERTLNPNLNQVTVWDISRAKAIFEITGQITKAALSPKANYLLTYENIGGSSSQSVIRLYNLQTQKIIFEKNRETKLEITNSFSSNEKYILTMDDSENPTGGYSLRVYRALDASLVFEKKVDENTSNFQHSFSPDSRHLLIQSYFEDMSIIDLDVQKEVLRGRGLRGSFSQDGRFIAYYDRWYWQINLFDLKEQKLISSIPYSMIGIDSISLSSDNKRALMTSIKYPENKYFSKLAVADFETQKILFEDTHFYIRSAKLSPNGNFLLYNVDMSSGSYASIRAELHDVNKRSLVSEMRIMDSGLTPLDFFIKSATIDFSPDGQYILTGLRWAYWLQNGKAVYYDGGRLYKAP
jgi:hypothetical protein